MMKVMNVAVSARHLRGVFLLILALAIVAGYLFLIHPSPVRSVELGMAAKSPSGDIGGLVVPASCPSYAHSPGECSAPPAPPAPPPPPPTDQCTNIQGLQATVPSGYSAEAKLCRANNCDDNPYSTSCDRCPNIENFQAGVPAGYKLRNGSCIEIETCSISASSADLQFGQSTTISWSCSQSSSADGSGFSTGNAPSGSAVVTPEDTTTYSLQCHEGCGDDIVVKVADPSLAISANPLRVRSGNSAMLYWGATQATNCNITGPNVSAVGITGSISTGAIMSQSTYTLACNTSKGRRNASVTITLIPSQVEF